MSTRAKTDSGNDFSNESGVDPGARASKPVNTWTDVLLRFKNNKTSVAGLIIFLIICLACFLAPYITRWDYTAINAKEVMLTPSFQHLLGTDNLGRDLFSRLLHGGRVTLRIACVSTVLAAVVGCVIGTLAGYFGGRTDFLISPVLDILASVPMFLLIIVFEATLGWGKGYFMYAMAIAAIPQFARLTRATVMNIMGCEYIEAARALGVGNTEIILRHVLHNAAPPLVVRFTTSLAEALVTCTIMGYVGIGINPPTPEWGSIVYYGKAYFRTRPHFIIIPCIVIIICVISIGVFGDGLRDAMDPREQVTSND